MHTHVLRVSSQKKKLILYLVYPGEKRLKTNYLMEQGFPSALVVYYLSQDVAVLLTPSYNRVPLFPTMVYNIR